MLWSPISEKMGVGLSTKARTEFSKRDWVYSGLSHPAGVALARSHDRRRLSPGSKILVVGDEHAAAIGQFLGKLALDARMNLRFEWERGQLFERWAIASRLERSMTYRPDVVLVAMPTNVVDPSDLVDRLKSVKKACSTASVAYVLPLERNDTLSLALPAADIDAFHTDEIEIHRSPTGSPSAKGYAGWAGAIWGWIR